MIDRPNCNCPRIFISRFCLGVRRNSTRGAERPIATVPDSVRRPIARAHSRARSSPCDARGCGRRRFSSAASEL
jgi:hypothetical protein